MNVIENESHLFFDYTTYKKEMSHIRHFFRFSSYKIYITNFFYFLFLLYKLTAEIHSNTTIHNHAYV
ncbi:hypothetical protein COJ27_21510 [Bacillus cereus]|uniref:Uncharacterized protein n=1 Tax=Bacillus cereus TaxID=1396 RepID=A0A9X6VJX4_BACCE|nr:hypothetical protein CN284_06520 [Bacillus cereus]PFD20725.1 hypothetical protein CN263_16160 [Bacillus cereus]PFL60513.1 hypothetical protein COJ27_21510 [Bacillus cereus]